MKNDNDLEQAYQAGWKAAKADMRLGHISDYARVTFETDPMYKQAYSNGYNDVCADSAYQNYVTQ